MGVVRTGASLAVFDHAQGDILAKSGIACAVLLLLGWLLMVVVSRQITRPLEELRQGAERFARGDLSSRLPDHYSEETGRLATTMNDMAAPPSHRTYSSDAATTA